MQESVNGGGDVNEKSGGDENNQGGDGVDGGFAAARQHSEADLDDADHGEHEEHAAHDRPRRRRHHPKSQHLQIDVSPKNLVHIPAVEQIDGQLQPLRHQRREQEEAERHHLENQQLLRHLHAGVAGGGILEAVLPRRRQRQPHEHGDRE